MKIMMTKKKILMLLIVVVIVATLMTGCSKDVKAEEPQKDVVPSEYGVIINEDTVVFTDSTKTEVTIKKNPQRVVVLQNSLLEVWDSCGGKVVGRVEASDEKPVESAMSAEVVGSLSTPSLEKILSLKPDLVFVLSNYSAHKDMIPVLQQSNIQVAAFDNDVREDYYKTLKIFSSLTGRDDLYEEIMSQVKDGVEEVITKAATDKNYKVLILFASSKSITTRDSKTMVGEMLKDLNTVNIVDSEDKAADTKTFSMEKIIQENPDFIFVQTMGKDIDKIKERLKADAESNPAWASLKAVKEDKYIVLPKDLYMYKPNIRYKEAYEGLAKILYPEIFK